MPHYWNNILVVTKDELVPRFWKTYNSLKSVLNTYKDKDYGIQRARRGGGKYSTVLISFDSLPIHLQDEIGDPRKLNHILEHYYSIDPDAVKYYSSFQYPDGSYLLPETKEQYIANASMVQALLRLKEDRIRERSTKGGTLRGLNQTLIDDAITFNEILEKKLGMVKHNLPVSRRFNDTLKSFIDQSYFSLIKDPLGKRKKNALKNTDETQALLKAMFVRQKFKPTPTKIANQYDAFLNGYVQVVNTDTGEIYNPKEFKQLSTTTITNFLATWNTTIATHPLRNGNRQKLMQKFKPYHSLEAPYFASSLISIDDRQPPFEYEKGKRMWFYNGIDLASEAFICFVYGKSKEGIILEFYRQLVRNYHEWGFNLPAELECESSLNSSFKNTFLKEGVMFEHVRIEANNARGKRIEAYFKPLRYELEKEREGWLARPFSKSEPNQISNVPKKIIPYETLTNECLNDFVTWNNMEHSKEKGKTRWEIFLERQNPNIKPTNYKALLPYLGYHTETSCNAGIVRLQSRLWLLGDNGEIFTGEKLIRLMRIVESNKIDIYWLDDNQGKVFKALVYIDGRYICEVLPKEKYSRAKIELTKEGEAVRELMMRYENTVNGYMKSQKNAIEKVEVTDYRTKTLNNKFQIPGLTSYKKQTEPVEEVKPLENVEYPFVQKEVEGDGWKSNFRL